jgi:RNA polymerase primary sigma factor
VENLDGIRLSLDEISEALKKISADSIKESQSLDVFYNKVAAHFPQIEYQKNESDWDDEVNSDTTFKPLWWDELDEEYELDEFYWVKSFQKLELLKPVEVQALMESIEAGVLAEEAIERILGKNKIKYDISELERVSANGQESFDRMVTHNLKLVLNIARRYSRRITLEEAFACGVFGLIHAIKKFDWKLGHQFSTYATWWITQSISREIADTYSLINIPVHAGDRVNQFKREQRDYYKREYTSGGDIEIKNSSTGITQVVKPDLPKIFEPEIDTTLKFALQADASHFEFWNVYSESAWLLREYENSEPSFEIDVLQKFNRIELDSVLSTLSKRESEIIYRRFGFYGNPQTLDEIGKAFNVTRERIRQIESKVLSKLRHPTRSVSLRRALGLIN